MRALVLGRFQPTHLGHLACLKEAAARAQKIVVVIGSAQRSHSLHDPFTAGERVAMLADAAKDAKLPVEHIIPVPDLDQYHLWVSQVRAYTPAFDVVVTGSPMTALLFQQAGFDVARVQPVERSRFAGTAIRRRLFAGERVNDAVPPTVAAFLDRVDIQARLRALSAAAEGTHG